jgi:hypothetical protein
MQVTRHAIYRKATLAEWIQNWPILLEVVKIGFQSLTFDSTIIAQILDYGSEFGQNIPVHTLVL